MGCIGKYLPLVNWYNEKNEGLSEINLHFRCSEYYTRFSFVRVSDGALPLLASPHGNFSRDPA